VLFLQQNIYFSIYLACARNENQLRIIGRDNNKIMVQKIFEKIKYIIDF